MVLNSLTKSRAALLWAVPLLLSACSTSSYKVKAQSDVMVELEVSSNRVSVECEYQDGYDGDVKDPHGFMMHVLDEENTVLSMMLPRVISGQECSTHLKGTIKVLKSASKVLIGGAGALQQPRSQSKNHYTFAGLGTFPGNGRIFNYWSIWTDKGSCYDVVYGTKKPCPREEFPLPAKP